MEKLFVENSRYYPYLCIIEYHFSEKEHRLDYFGGYSYDEVIRWIVQQGDIFGDGGHYEGCLSYKFFDVALGQPLKIYAKDYARVAQEMERMENPKKAEKNAWWYEDMMQSDELLYG